MIQMQIQNKIRQVRLKLAEKGVQALWVSQPDNLYYLSGCESLEGYLLISDQKAILVTDFRYIEQACQQSPEYEIFRTAGKMAQWLPELFSGLHIERLGVEGDHLSFTAYRQMEDIFKQAGLPVRLISADGLVNSLRAVKSPEELELITRAVKITDAALAHVEEILHPGLTEIALAWEIEKFMREHGSQPVPFELIVAAGPSCAMPHAKPTGHIIQAGEPIVVDIGAKYRYYGGDLTRTFYCGQPDDTFKRIYDAVLRAQQTGIAGIRAGMTGSEADAVVRTRLAREGYAEAFGHGLGHGIGLVTHENPRVAATSPDLLANGMVFTIEPGIYINAWGGVRIEDDVVLENGKVRVISSARK
jgi:Xaa-Pro aminopeptidase